MSSITCKKQFSQLQTVTPLPYNCTAEPQHHVPRALHMMVNEFRMKWSGRNFCWALVPAHSALQILVTLHLLSATLQLP